MHGFEVRSDLSFQLLRPGPATDHLRVIEQDEPLEPPTSPPLLEWQVEVPDPLHVRVWDNGAGSFVVWAAGGGCFAVEPRGRTVAIPPDGDPLLREERLWGLPAVLCAIDAGVVPLHAAAVEVSDRAVLLAGAGGYGKTTLAAACLSAGLPVLAEDIACCVPGTPARLHPGPAVLRVRTDSYEQLDLDDRLVAAVEPNRVHVLAGRPPASGEARSIAAVLLLDVATDGRVTLEPVDASRAVQELWVMSFNLPTDDDRRRCFQSLVDLVVTVPVLRFARPLGFERLGDSVAHIVETFAA